MITKTLTLYRGEEKYDYVADYEELLDALAEVAYDIYWKNRCPYSKGLINGIREYIRDSDDFEHLIEAWHDEVVEYFSKELE